MDWSAIEELVLQGSVGMYVMVCRRVGRSETQCGRFDLTAAHARSLLNLLPMEERMEADLALTDRDGGVGDLDEPALGAVLRIAEVWTAQRIEQQDSTTRVKLRTVAGDVVKTFTVAAPSPEPVDEHPDRTPGPVDTGTVNQILGAGRANVQGGVRDLIVLEERRHHLDRERRLEHRSETMELLGYDRERSNELISFYREQLAELRKSFDAERDGWGLERTHLKDRVLELEGTLNRVYSVAMEKAADARVADAAAGQSEVNVREIGRSVRELGSIALKAGMVYTMRETLTPELLASLDKVLTLDDNVLSMFGDPTVQSALADPDVMAMLKDPDQRQFLLGMLKQQSLKESA